MSAKACRSDARQALSGNWGKGIITTLVASVLGVFGGSLFSAAASQSEEVTEGMTEEASAAIGQVSPSLQAAVANAKDQLNEIMATPAGKIAVSIVAGFAAIALFYAIFLFLFGGALELGYRNFTLNLVDRKGASFGDLFGKLNMWWKGLAMRILRGLFLFLWALLFIFPCIIKAYAYAMTPYILQEEPELTANQAINKSKELMRGNKWSLFCLQLSFIGWDLLTLITLGIAGLWVKPYKEVAEAAFYRRIRAEKGWA